MLTNLNTPNGSRIIDLTEEEFKKLKLKIIEKNEIPIRAIIRINLLPTEVMWDLAQEYCEMPRDKFEKLFKEESTKLSEVVL